ncbi:hypothetical protein [Zobellia sp. B3R18]|uniref:hypothetical protein n=2 Tax=Zobellia TaxID=112040 RepID=UPI001C06DAFE|nr:hypothetical protein [Zobellia sp. B3R18]MBU2973649.1 hypothetical protein [Zobellia sp. B3R18]
MKNVPLIVLLFLAQLAYSQVKIGDNINQIDAASLMELESASRVLVVTRVTNAQMSAITPLNGALVFNTDEACLFQYKNNVWTSLCVNVAAGETVTALLDNNDGTVTYTNEAGTPVTFSKANLTDNLDGSFTFTNGSSALNFVGTDNQNLESATLDQTSSSLLIEIESGSSTSADLSALEESADIAAVQNDVDQNEADTDAAILAVQNDVDQNEADADAAILAVQNDVDQNEVDADAAILAVQNDVDQNEADADAAILAVQNDVNQNETDADAAILAVQNDVNQNEADADAAIALKENSANKSDDVTLADATNTKFPTELAVKTYVDGQIAATADDDITGASIDASSILKIDEGTSSVTVDLSALEESADITAVQNDVDQNEADADAAILAVQNDVDQNEADADAAILAVQNDVDQNEADADAAILAVQNDVDQNEADADAAIALKENSANKSDDVTLADATNTKFPTELAVKTYVDGQIAATADDDITGASIDASSVLKIDEGTSSVTVDLSALEESADITAVQNDVDQNEADADAAILAVQNDVDQNEADADAAILAVQNDVDQNEADADAAILAVQNDVDQNEADADAAIALKEDSANKSDDVTLADATNTKFPTELAVKTYVDEQIAATADDDITGASIDASSVLKIDEGTSSVTVDLSALEESADITAVQNDVDQNEADADAAILAVQNDVDQNEADADAAILAVQNDVDQNEADADSAILAVQNDVNQNEADADAAIALKEDSANKSDDVTLADATNTKFPTELAVKTYVDGQIAATADDDITGASIDASSVLKIDEGTSSVTVDLSALEESADITAVQNDVDQNEADADAAILAVQNDVDQNEADADAAILAVQNDVDQNEVDADNAIAAVQNDVNQNEADADAAFALKEDTANKSDDVTLADATNTKFPTELAVKTYVDGQIAATADDDITGASIDASSVLKIDEGTSSVTVDLSALEESADITAVQNDVDQNEADADAAILAVQNDVNQNEADADAAILAVQNDVDQNEADADAAIALKEDSANKSDDVTLADATNTKFPTELAVKTYVDGQIAATADDDITGASIDASSVLKIDEGTSSVTVDLSTLEESADITAVQNDVDQNEADADAAILAVQNDIDQNEADADAAILAVQNDVDQNEIDADNAIAAVQADVDQNEADADDAILAVQNDVDQNEADADAAIALKEDSANKSDDVTLADATNTKFPTELAVKTYVDGQIAATADDDITGASIDASSVLKIDEGSSSVTVDLSALEESADITAVQNDVDQNEADADAAILAVQNDVDQNEADADAAILAVQNDVNQNEADADAAIIAVQNDVDQNEADADAAILAVKNDVDQNEADADAAILAVQNDVNQNEADADAAIALKEDTANKSDDVTLADATNTKFPTELAVKTYVDGQITATADDDITGASIDASSILKIDEGTSSVTVDLSALEESADITAVQNDVDQNEADADAAILAVQNDVDQNEADADNAILAVQNDVNQNEADADAAILAVQNDVDQNEADADAAIALKEDSANKSDDVTLADATNTKFPTELAVKTYVDGQIAATADDDITGASIDASSILKIDEGTSSVTVDLSALEESADITAVQNDVDQNEADADAAILAVQNDVDQNEADADAAILAVQNDVDQNEGDADAAILAVQNDVDQNEADADAAIALKEDSANKSDDVTLADATNTKFPTELAVKTYVDGQIAATADDDITGASIDASSVLKIDEGTSSVTVDLSALEESADITAVQNDVDQNEADADAAILAVQNDVDQNEADADAAILTVQNDVDQNEADADAAILAVQNDVDQNEADADAAIALKEDSANKSDDVTLADATNTKFPTELAVKTYVDGQIAATADDDITGASIDASSVLKIDEGTSSVTVDLSALEESADITAVQNDVDQNEADADAAILAVQNDVDQNEADADAAILAVQNDVNQNETDADAAILAVQNDVNQNEADTDAAILAVQNDVNQNEADADAAIALKEDSANKSDDVTLADATNTKFPTELAVKTYVDGQIAATADDDITGASIDASSVLKIDEGTSSVTVDLSALEESADITAVQNDVDQNEADADAAILAVQNDVNQNEADADTAIAANAAAITAHNSSDNDLSETNEIQTLSISGNDLSISGTGGNTVTLPSISGTEGSLFFADASGNPTENNSQLFWDATNGRLGVGTNEPDNKFQVAGAIRSRGILNSDGTTNEPAYRFADDTNTGMYSPAADEIGFTVGSIEAMNIDETSNSTTVTINETLELNGPVLDENDSPGTAGQVLSATATGTEWVDPATSTGNASISADAGNSITAGSDSGVFYASPIKAFGKVSATGAIVKSTPNIIVTKLAGLGHYLVTLPIGITLDSDYIIQLSQPGRDGAGNDDPGISYSNQTVRTFEVIIGDNDNGGTDRARFDSEFMFTVLDL